MPKPTQGAPKGGGPAYHAFANGADSVAIKDEVDDLSIDLDKRATAIKSLPPVRAGPDAVDAGGDAGETEHAAHIDLRRTHLPARRLNRLQIDDLTGVELRHSPDDAEHAIRRQGG